MVFISSNFPDKESKYLGITWEFEIFKMADKMDDVNVEFLIMQCCELPYVIFVFDFDFFKQLY